ncbi:MAG TPA: AI-2E family transporter [Anaerolineae bacterium]
MEPPATSETVPEAKRVSSQPDRSKLSQPWWQLTLAGASALILGIGFLWALMLFAWPLALLILGLSIATALVPVVGWLENWLPRTVSILIVYLILLLILVAIGWIVFPPLVNQVQDAAERLPQLIGQARERLTQFTPWQSLNDIPLVETVSSQLAEVSSTLVMLPLRFFSSLFDLVVVIFISLYSLIVAPQARQFALSLFPAGRRPRVDNVLGEMSQAMGGYIRGVVIDSFIVGILTYIGLVIIGVDFALVLAIMAGLMEIIPFVGPVIAGIAIVLVALLQSPTTALITLVFVVILQQIESNILVPNIMHSQTEISPLLTILALVAGHSIGGLLGALIAIPLAAALRVFIREVVAPSIRRQTGAAST